MMNDEQALAYIDSELASKRIASVRGKIKALKTLTKDADPNVARLATHVLKYTEQEYAEERFAKHLPEAAAAKGKKPSQLVPAEVKSIRKAFDKHDRSR